MTSLYLVLILLILLIVRNLVRRKKPAQWIVVGAGFCIIYLLIMRYVGGIYNVPSASMMPTLNAGDYITGLRVGGFADSGKILRGDVVIFNAPSVPRTMYIKRVIAVAGDVLEFKSDKSFILNGLPIGRLKTQNEKVIVFTANDERSNKPYEFIIDKTVPFLKSRDSWKVPEGFYFMAGDNRDHSWDSRYWENPPGTPKNLRGLVKKDQIISRYVSTLFNFGFYTSYDPLEGALRVIRNNVN